MAVDTEREIQCVLGIAELNCVYYASSNSGNDLKTPILYRTWSSADADKPAWRIYRSVKVMMWNPPRLCPWSSTVHYVHISSQYPYFISFVKSPSVCWWHTTFPVFSPIWLWLICCSSSKCSATHILLDDCQPVNIKLFQNRISAHRSPKNNSLKFTTSHSIPLIQFGNLVSSSTVISLSPTKYHLSLNLVIITFVNFVVSAPILTSKLPVPLPHLLFTLSLITATLFITTF